MNFDFKFINFGILIFSTWKFSGHKFHVKRAHVPKYWKKVLYLWKESRFFLMLIFKSDLFWNCSSSAGLRTFVLDIFFCLSINLKLRKRFRIINLKYFLESDLVLNFITLFVTICNILESKLILKFANLFLFISHLRKQLIILIHFLIIWK